MRRLCNHECDLAANVSFAILKYLHLTMDDYVHNMISIMMISGYSGSCSCSKHVRHSVRVDIPHTVNQQQVAQNWIPPMQSFPENPGQVIKMKGLNHRRNSCSLCSHVQSMSPLRTWYLLGAQLKTSGCCQCIHQEFLRPVEVLCWVSQAHFSSSVSVVLRVFLV